MRFEPVLQSSLLGKAPLRLFEPREAPRPLRSPARTPRKIQLELWAAALLILAAVGVRFWFATRVKFCGTPDSCFYLGVAQGLERTGTFHVNFIYDLLLPHLHLPNTGIEYWRPGTSFFLLPAHWFGGVTLHRSAAITTVAGVVWAAAAWHIARLKAATRNLALPSFALALLLPAGWTGSLTPDSTLFYAAAVAWFLALFTVERQGARQDALALVCIGIAYLIRNDAVLLFAPLLTVLILRARRAARGASGLGQRMPGTAPGIKPDANPGINPDLNPIYIASILAGFIAVLLPMHLLYRFVLGTPLPAGVAQTLWMKDLCDFNLYGAALTPASLLAHGPGALLRDRLVTPITIVYRVLAILVGYTALVFLPGLLQGLQQHEWPQGERPRDMPSRTERQLPEGAGPLVFTGALLLVYGLLLPAVGVFSALRSAVGLLPWMAVLVMAGLQLSVRGERVRAWACVVLLTVYAVGGVMQTRHDLEDANLMGSRHRELATRLATLGAKPETSVVMTPDPVQFAVTTGFAAVPVPGNGLDAMRAEAKALGVTHVILNLDRLPAAEEETARVLGAVRRVLCPEAHVVLLELDRRTP